MEGIFARRGHTYGVDIHAEGTYLEGICIWRGSAHEGSYTRRDVHTDEHIHTEGNAHERAYIRRDIQT